MAESGGGAENIGAIEVTVAANTQKAYEQLEALDALIENIRANSSITVTADTKGLPRQKSRPAPHEEPPQGSQRASQPAGTAISVTAHLEDNMATQIRAAVQKAFTEPFDIRLNIINLEEIRQKLGAIEVSGEPMPGSSAGSHTTGPATDLTLQQKRTVMQAELSQLKATEAMLAVWRNSGSVGHRTSINNLLDEAELRPHAYGSPDLGGGRPEDKVVRAMNGVLSGLRDPNLLKQFQPYWKTVGQGEDRIRTLQGVPDELIRRAAPGVDLSQEGVRETVLGAIQTLPLFRSDKMRGYQAYYDEQPAVAHAAVTAAPPETRVPAEAPVTPEMASAAQAAKKRVEEVQQKITEAYQRAIDVEPFNLGAVTGLAKPTPSTVAGAAYPREAYGESPDWTNGGDNNGRGWESKGPQSAARRAAGQRNTPARTLSGPVTDEEGHMPSSGVSRIARKPGGPRRETPLPPIEITSPAVDTSDLDERRARAAANEPIRVRPAEDVAADMERFARLGISRHSGGSQRRGSTSRTDNLSSMYSVGGIELPGLGTVDVGGLLRAISSGMGGSTLQFGEVIQGKNKGEIRRLRPTEGSSQEDFDALMKSVGHRAPITTASGERVRRIDAKELFRRILIEQYGQDTKAGEKVDEALENNPAIQMALKLVSARGTAPLSAARGVSQLASNPVHDARLAVQFKSVSEQIEPLEKALNNLMSSERVGPSRQKRIDTLKAQLEPLMAQRNELIDAGADTSLYITPDQRQLAAMRLHEREHGAASRARIEEGAGKTEAELLQEKLGPLKAQETRARIEEGELPNIFGAVAAAKREYNSPDFSYDTTNGPESNAGALLRLVRGQLGDLGFDLSKRNKRFVATPQTGISVGREDQAVINEMLSAALSAEFGDETTRNMYAERSLTGATAGRGGHAVKGVLRTAAGGTYGRLDRGNAVTGRGPVGENGFVTLANPENPGTGPGHYEQHDNFMFEKVDLSRGRARYVTNNRRVLSAEEEQAAFRRGGGIGPGSGMAPMGQPGYEGEPEPHIPQFAAGNAVIGGRIGSNLPPAPPSGTPSGPMGSGGSGRIHVWIDGPFPLEVSGGGGGGGGGGGEETATGGPRIRTAPRRAMYRVVPAATRAESTERARKQNAVESMYARMFDQIESEENATRRNVQRGVTAYNRGYTPAASRQSRQEMYEGLFGIGGANDRRQNVLKRDREQRTNEYLTSLGIGTMRGGTLRPFQTEQSDRVIEAQARAQRQAGLTQSRSIGTTFVSMMENLVGGRQGLYERQRVASAATRRFAQVDTERQRLVNQRSIQLAGIEQTRGAMRRAGAAGDTEVVEDLSKRLKDMREGLVETRRGLQAINPMWNKFGEAMDDASSKVVTMGGVTQNLLAGAAGGVVGMVAMQGVSAIAQIAIKGVMDALGPSIENAMGNPNVAAQATRQNAQVLGQAGGNTGALAGMYAQQGLSAGAYGLIQQSIEQRSLAELGNTNLAALGGAQRVAANQQPNSLYQTTNGFFGTAINGTPSVAEILAGQITGLTNNGLPSGITVNPMARGLGVSNQAAPKQLADSLGKAEKNLAGFNDQAAKAGSSLELVQDTTGKFSEAVKAAAAEARKNNNEQLAQRIEQGRLYVADKNAAQVGGQAGASSATDPLTAYLQALQSGSIIQDPSLLLKQSAWQRQAHIGAQTAMTQFQLGTSIPAGFGMAQAFNPIGDLTSPLRALGINVPGLSTQLAQVSQQALAGQGAAQGLVNQQAPEFAKQFADAMGQAAQYGQQISSDQIAAQTQQAAYQAAQWSQQIYISKRNLSDARGLVGEISGIQKDNVGVLERQNFLLGVQLQDLGFMLQQRQINYRLALAGFTAPGLTGEERAARIEEAKIEAAYAQKQLDLQKQIAQVGRTQFRVTASRSLTDALRSFNLLEQGINTSKFVTAVEARAKALSALQDQQAKKATTIYSLAEQRAGDVISTAEALAAATGKGIAEVSQLVMNTFVQDYNTMVKTINNSSFGFPTGGGGGGGSVRKNAVGFLGNVSGATPMIVGEAGTETVAILRNPRQVSSPMGGGGGGLTLVITGNNISSEHDMDLLLSKARVEMERWLGRRASMVGLRTP